MPIPILMPALSPTMTEGNLAKWLKKEGEEVASGDVLAEIETDKATMEVEAVEEGRLGKILVDEGTEGIAVNTPIALLLEEGEDESDLEAAAAKAAEKSGKAEKPAEGDKEKKPEPAKKPKAEAADRKPAKKAERTPAKPEKPAAKGDGEPETRAGPAPRRDGERVFSSPLARRMAKQAGLDLAGVTGSGPHGRIVKADVEAALAAGTAPAEAAPPEAREAPPGAAPAVEAPGMPEYDEVKHSSMRKVIARRLAESKRDAPHFYLTVDCEIDELLKVRKELNARSPEGDDAYKISVNDLVVRAAALALRKVPAANASWTDTAIRRYRRADISVAVAVADGLITPVIRGADRKGLADISREMKDLAGRARDGKLKPEEYQGGTFSVSNLGMYGIREFAAVINPPQGCILAVGTGEQRPVVRDGALAVATVMTCTLSIDHRAVDGAVGAEFLAAFKALIEDPLTMLL